MAEPSYELGMVRKSFRALARFFSEAHYIHQEPEEPSRKRHEGQTAVDFGYLGERSGQMGLSREFY
jgi:hypothetical protein